MQYKITIQVFFLIIHCFLWQHRVMSDELTALLHNRTWNLVPAHPSPFSKWEFQVKKHPNSFIDGYKIRLVAKDFHQHTSIDINHQLTKGQSMIDIIKLD